MERSIRPHNYMSSFIGKEILEEFGAVDWNSTLQKSINNNAISIATSIGLKRSRNEDRCAVAQISSLNGNQYSLAIVCDGVGGSELGDQAANIAIATVIEEILLSKKIIPLSNLADEVIRKADLKVKSTLNGSGMTTLSMILSSLTERDIVAANVGDSRVYSWSGEMQKVSQVTVDDTFENVLRNRNIEDDSFLDARGLRGTLFQAIGEVNRANVDLSVRLYGKDYFDNSGVLLVTDGAWKVDEYGFSALAKNCISTHDVVRRILTFSNWIGGVDNVSAIAIESIESFISGNFNSTINFAELGSVTLWSADAKLTVRDSHSTFEQSKSATRENIAARDKKANHAKRAKRREIPKSTKSQSKNKQQSLDPQPQLELVSVTNQDISSDQKKSNDDERYKQHSNRIKVEISTDKN